VAFWSTYAGAIIRVAGGILGKSPALRATACVRKTTRDPRPVMARGFVHGRCRKTAVREPAMQAASLHAAELRGVALACVRCRSRRASFRSSPSSHASSCRDRSPALVSKRSSFRTAKAALASMRARCRRGPRGVACRRRSVDSARRVAAVAVRRGERCSERKRGERVVVTPSTGKRSRSTPCCAQGNVKETGAGSPSVASTTAVWVIPSAVTAIV